MRKVERGVSCAGCPHRAAYVACKEALGRGKNKVICGNAGCAETGYMHPAATTCAGGEDALLPRYKQEIPSGGTADQPAAEACIHFALDEEVAAADACKVEHDLSEETFQKMKEHALGGKLPEMEG